MRSKLRRDAIGLSLVLLLASLGSAVSLAGFTAGAARAQSDGESTLIVAVSRDLQNLDPTSASSDGFTSEILTNIYHWLIDYQLTQDENGQPVFDANNFVGDVAESFEVVDSGKKVIFKIRPGAKFANGDPIDANVVKFTYDRLFDQGTTAAALTKMAKVSGKDSVKVIDDLTVEFTIDEPNTLLFGNMAQYGHSILNPKVLEPYMTEADPAAHEWLKANTTGNETGPYVLESWKPGVEFVLAKNPNWWGEPPKTDRIIFRIVPDATTRFTLLQQGEVDIAKDIAPKDLLELENDPNITVHRFSSRIVSYIGMNATMPPFDNVKVRQAISYAIPYQTIIDNVLYGYGIQLTSVIPAGTPTHTDEFFTYTTDPEKAKALLAEAGYPNGLDVTFSARSDLAESKGVAIWLKSELAKAGINVTINEMEGAAFTASLQKHELAFFHHPGWISINNDPFYHVYWHLQSECCDYTNYSNPEINSLIDQYTISTDEAARAEAARRIQEIAVGEAVWGFLYQPDITLATRSNVKGVVYNPADRYWRYYFMYKE
jgi:peptide/nickel transport system substrate-binding protein